MRRTRQEILEYTKRHGRVTVDDLAVELGVVPVTVRAHIAALERENLIKGEEVRSGRAGRPRIVYSLTDEALKIFPKNYDGLANRLLDVLSERKDPEELRALFQDAGKRWSLKVSPSIQNRGMEEKVDKVAGLLNREGCDAEWEKQDDVFLIRFFNCPYVSVVEEYPQLCAMEKTFLEETLELPVEIRQSGPGVHCCIVAAGPA